MTDETLQEEEQAANEERGHSASLRVALALAAIAAVGTGIAIQQILERRLSKPERARLRFMRYLRERGRLES